MKGKHRKVLYSLSVQNKVNKTKTWLGEMRKGLIRKRLCRLPLFAYFWTKSPLILCLNVFRLLADFKSDGRLFHIAILSALGKMTIFVQKYFYEMEILI